MKAKLKEEKKAKEKEEKEKKQREKKEKVEREKEERTSEEKNRKGAEANDKPKKRLSVRDLALKLEDSVSETIQEVKSLSKKPSLQELRKDTEPIVEMEVTTLTLSGSKASTPRETRNAFMNNSDMKAVKEEVKSKKSPGRKEKSTSPIRSPRSKKHSRTQDAQKLQRDTVEPTPNEMKDSSGSSERKDRDQEEKEKEVEIQRDNKEKEKREKEEKEEKEKREKEEKEEKEKREKEEKEKGNKKEKEKEKEEKEKDADKSSKPQVVKEPEEEYPDLDFVRPHSQPDSLT